MTVLTVTDDLKALFEVLHPLASKDFWTTLIGTLVGALTAYALTARNEEKKLVLTEDTAITRAFQVTLTLLNSAVNFKKQVVQPKVSEMDELTELIESSIASSHSPTILQIRIHQLMLTHPKLDLASREVDKLVHNLNSLAGRPIHCAGELQQSCKLLDFVIEELNTLIDEQRNSVATTEERICTMLGLMRPETDTTDERFRSVIGNLQKLTDDVLYFSVLLLRDLEAHQTKWRKLKGMKKRQRLKFVGLGENDVLLPDKALYLSWQDLPTTILD